MFYRIKTPPILSFSDKIGGVRLFYTKHHLKFGKNQANNLDILDFGADFSCILLVFSIITACGAGRKTRPLQNLSGKISFLQRADIESAPTNLGFYKKQTEQK